MTRRRLVSLAVLLALAPAVAGCGGGGDKKSTSAASTPTGAATQATTAASTAAYQTKVQIILTSVGTAGSALGTAAKSSNSAADIAAALTSFQASVKQAADQLGKLTAPAQAQAGQDQLEQVLREIGDGVQPSIVAAKAGNRAKFATTFRAYQARLQGDYRKRLTAAGAKIDQALAGK
jgi:predicted small lipoprotein YifL